MTLNEQTYVEAAQGDGIARLAARRTRRAESDEFSRSAWPPGDSRPNARRALQGFWEEQYRYFEERTADALMRRPQALKIVPKEVNIHKAAAWVMVSRAILNLDETLTKE